MPPETQQQSCRIETSVMEDFHIEPKSYNIVANITDSGDVKLIINKDRLFQTLKNHGKIVGSINKKMNELLGKIVIPTEDFAYLADRETIAKVGSLMDVIIEKRLDALAAKEQKQLVAKNKNKY